jgi:hypothetical protein
MLEDRVIPAMSVLSQGGNLLITGTPAATSPLPTVGWAEALTVTRVSVNLYEVVDGPVDLGTYPVAKNITIRLDSIDNDIIVDLAGGRLPGDLTVDLGAGDRNRFTPNRVVLAGGGEVGGSVTFLNSSSDEFFAIGETLVQSSFQYVDASGRLITYHYTSFAESPVAVKEDATAIGQPVSQPFEDGLLLGAGSAVERDVLTRRITYTLTDGDVGRDLTALATETPGGIGFRATGKVGRDISVVGAATAPGYYSYVLALGPVGRDVGIELDGGFAFAIVSGPLGRDVRMAINDGSAFAAVGDVGRDVWYSARVPTTFEVDGPIGRDVNVALATPVGVGTEVDVIGAIGRNLTIHDGPGDLAVQLGEHFEYYDPETGDLVVIDLPATIAGDVTVAAGDGTNSLAVNGAAGTAVGGTVTYVGGTGADTVTINGSNTFALIAWMGGGDDTVAFAPDARVGSAKIIFGTTGTKTWVPPLVIDFPLILVNYP